MSYNFNILHYLYVKKRRFHKWFADHPTKIMFRFTLNPGEITLTGWAPDKKNDDDDDYDKADLLNLEISTDTNPVSGDTIFLGNIRLSKADVKNIDDQASSNSDAHYILFKPVNYSFDPKHVAYEVYLSKTTSAADILPTLAAVAKADPSPPATRK